MTVDLSALDGSNPMGFLAGLGALAAGPRTWRLGWRQDGTWSAYLEGPDDRAEIVAVLVADREEWAAAGPLADLADEDDIKMPPDRFRAHAQRLLGTPTARWLGILGNELALDGGGRNIKPTALHFTAGRQKFLDSVREIRGWEDPERGFGEQLHAALFDVWRRRDPVKSLRWDAGSSRYYALRFEDPSGDKKLAEAGAEWLAYRGLRALPSAPAGGRLHTACVGGGWKNGWLRWPLWQRAAPFAEVEALLAERRIAGLSRAQRAERGIFAVFTSKLDRFDQKGYGSFAPSRPAREGDDPA